jgi:cob(I)alamin adenosyltransferase
MALKIYTKTGDGGKTSLLGGTKVPKNHARIESYGNTDELNSFLGFLNDQIRDKETNLFLKQIQDRLFIIGSMLAMDTKKKSAIPIPILHEADVLQLEKKIDEMDKELPPMKSFVLPGGHPLVSTAHICRTVCRRAERSVVSLQIIGEIVDPVIIKYLNRLSDYFFMLARWLAKMNHAEEILWQPRIDDR